MSADATYASYEATAPNPYLLRKLNFPEHPMKVTTEYWSGETTVVSEESVRRAIVERMLQKLSFQEIRDLAEAVDETRKPLPAPQ